MGNSRVDRGQHRLTWYPADRRAARRRGNAGQPRSQGDHTMLLTRRQMLAAAGASAAALLVAPRLLHADVDKKAPFELPPLPYAYDALEPSIDAETMMIHHDRH